jgi:hypothetical protein
MSTVNLLYQRQFRINDSISVTIPTVGQVIDDEDSYYGLVSILTAMPIDLIAQLDDAGIDFTSVNSYDIFLMMFNGLKTQDTSLVFGDLDLSKFQIAMNEQNGNIVLVDPEKDIVIDRLIHSKIADVLRRIHNLDKNRRKPANEEAKEYMLKRAREKYNRHKNKKEESQLESLIVSMVNTEQFKYNFDTVRDLSIYQFNESVRQIIKKVDYEHRMSGVYAGTISVKDLSQDDLNWLSHK